MKLLNLQQMQSGQKGRVAEVQGGSRLITRLGALGINPGRRITKISSMLMRGPVTIQSDHTQLAIGYGMAAKILVKIDDGK